ncbi:TPA: L-arabinose ABC transporter permease AraH, partial [Yersinia enterocolitica]
MSSVTLSSDKKTPASPQSQPPQEAPAKRGLGLSRIWDSYGMLVVFAVVFIGCVIFVPNFGSFINMKGLGLAISMSGMVACGMLFCLASGDFDLSVASVIACAGVTTAVVINMTE